MAWFCLVTQALFNLLAREDTREELCKNDVPYALVRLAKLEDRQLNELCIVMLRNLSAEVVGAWIALWTFTSQPLLQFSGIYFEEVAVWECGGWNILFWLCIRS